jgi:hypothetical protein
MMAKIDEKRPGWSPAASGQEKAAETTPGHLDAPESCMEASAGKGGSSFVARLQKEA